MNDGEDKPKGTTTTAIPMESLAAIAAALLSSKHVSPSDAARSSPSSLILLPGGRLLHLLRRFLLLSLHALLSLLFFLLSPAFSHLPSSSFSPATAATAPDGTTAADRALAHVLSTVSRVPVASRKYELVRSLADRLLDDNLRLGAATGLNELNRAALSAAFSRNLQCLEAATAAAISRASPTDRSLDMIIGAVRSGMRRFAAAAAVAEEGDVVGVGGAGSAEKMAAEALWLGQKMAECGAAVEAVAQWGAAARLGRLALSAEPRLQVALVRVSAFLFKHANSKQMEEWKGEGEDGSIAHYRMAMLTSWLPLLCRASNGVGAPIMSSGERVEMLRVLEEIIEKLSWEQQEEILALWLHHFTSCPDSDWPNLVSCYTRWYSESRKFLLK
ncbi:uncharacterized protein LOC103697933 [Phoenix dactylifera]|uniref:Uncharacterized protein LOC103697933 n=1 Tax=Phoenix dactylifera TaxID=42345 RepID=A0A8B9AC05_PHODC|nr:uncharacterized protein LOC103697933 [Phoenix dactylifera]XP_038983262.1 uncharacterized protein LOC103697933 [Phoenix dactylifera]